MSAGLLCVIIYFIIALLCWPWLYGWRLRANRLGRHVDNSHLFEAAFESFWCACAWPFTLVCRTMALFVRVVARTSNRAWWVPRSMRDNYRRR